MPRPLKPYKVDHVTSPNGYTVADVMFDRDAKAFFVEIVPGDRDSRVVADTIVEVKREARAALARAQAYDWTALIIVSVKKPEPWFHGGAAEHAGVELEFKRLERAPNPARPGQFVARAHPLDAPETDGPNRKKREEHRDISGYSGPDEIGPSTKDEGEALLLYEQSVWDGLCAVKRVLDDVCAKLTAITQRADAARLLSGAATSSKALLLGATGDK